MIECAGTDNKNAWDWAVLWSDDTWKAHGKAVEDAGTFLLGSFDWKSCNIAEKLNTSYKTSEFQLYTFRITPALLYGILPDHYWSNYCKLVHAFHILSQHQITFDNLKHAYVLFCKWELKFEQLCYWVCEDHLHFIHPCVHQVLHLVTKTMIGNIGQKIQQPSNLYANFAWEGVCHCQVNALLSIMLELHNPPKPLPNGALSDAKHIPAIHNFLGEHGPVPCICRWAHAQLPNGQVVCSLWCKDFQPLHKLHISCNIKFTCNGEDHVGEGTWQFMDVAILHRYSSPDQDLLILSSHTVLSSTLLDEFQVINIKAIKSIVAMVPHRPSLPSGVMEHRFFIVEKLRLDTSNLGIPQGSDGDDFDDFDDAGAE
ncbi:hypothetical protein V8B97DRAFT_2025633 [Scleroderma yunnanense]